MIVLTRFAIAAGLLLSGSFINTVAAQGGPGYFLPPTAAPPPAARPPAQPRPAPPRAPAVQVAPPQAIPGGGNAAAGAGAPSDAPVQVQLPPVPDLPALPRGAPPPAAVIGVLGIPDIMRASAAAQQVEKLIGERREKLNEDAQKEQGAWRDLQQTLANQRATLNADQIRTRERELQERITNSQRQFRDRNRFIQEAAQVGLAQIERMLIATIRQVAESRGMNLVLHRAQVALNVNEFDITELVVEQMNKTLPSIVLPPDGVSAIAAAQQTTPAGAGVPALVPAGTPSPNPAPSGPASGGPAPSGPAAPRR